MSGRVAFSRPFPGAKPPFTARKAIKRIRQTSGDTGGRADRRGTMAPDAHPACRRERAANPPFSPQPGQRTGGCICQSPGAGKEKLPPTGHSAKKKPGGAMLPVLKSSSASRTGGQRVRGQASDHWCPGKFWLGVIPSFVIPAKAHRCPRKFWLGVIPSFVIPAKAGIYSAFQWVAAGP